MTKEHNVLFVTGDRFWNDEGLIQRTLARSGRSWGTIWLIHGGARGADTIAGEAGARQGYQEVRLDANWRAGGRRMGPLRNAAMARLLWALKQTGSTITAYVFHDNLAESKGTRDMVARLDKLGIRWTHVHHEGIAHSQKE